MLARGAMSAPAIPGAAFYDIVGHSLPAGGGVTNGDWNGYVDKLMFLLGSPRRRRNYAIGGAVSCLPSGQNATGDGGWGHVLGYLAPPLLSAGGPYLPQSNVAVAHIALNDLGLLGQANPGPMLDAHRAIVGRLVAAAYAPSTDSTWTFTGTWGAATAVGGFGSVPGFRATSTLNDHAALAIPADYPGGRTVAISLLLNPAHDLTVGITIDGVAQPDVRLQGSVLCSPNGYNAAGVAKHIMKCLRYALPAAGAHTIDVKLKAQGIAGSQLSIDSAHVEADPTDGPHVLLPNPHRCVDYALWGASWAQGAAMSDAAVQAWQAQLLTLLSEFPQLLALDIDAVLGKAPGKFASDHAHPNDVGHADIAAAAYEALRASGRLVSSRLSRTSPAIAPFWIPVGSGVNSYPPFLNNWVNYGVPYPSAGFYRDVAGDVHLKGVVKNAPTGSATIFQLPVGYRPAATILRASVAGGALQQVAIDSSGNVAVTAGGTVTANCIDCSFPAEQ